MGLEERGHPAPSLPSFFYSMYLYTQPVHLLYMLPTTITLQMKAALIAGLFLGAVILTATGIEIYQDIMIFIPGEEVCVQQLGLAYRSGDLWLPVVNGTIYLNPTEQCTTDQRGYCNITVERDKVYAVKYHNNTVKLFIGCQEVLIIIRV